MKKVFMVLVAVLVLGAASMSAQNRLTAKIGLGAASISGIDNADPTVNFKLGAGYEFRINSLLGIEPGAMLAAKGYSWGDNHDVSLSYIEAPVMLNFHLGNHFVLAPGAYVAHLFDDDDTKAESLDYGARIGFKYVFDSGINLGIDTTVGATDVYKHISGTNNVTAAIFFGYSF